MIKTEDELDLSLQDQMMVTKTLAEKINTPESVDLEKNIQLSNYIIEKVVYFCTKLNGNLDKEVDWASREDIFHFFENFSRFFGTICDAIALTSGKENIEDQAARWQESLRQFFTLYLEALKEAEKHLTEKDQSLGHEALFQGDLEDLRLVLEDDMLQEIVSTNHIILSAIAKNEQTSPELLEMLANY